MTLRNIILVVFFLYITLSFIVCSGDDHEENLEHHDTDHSDQNYASQNYDDFEPHEFDYDPHETDSDYDEDLLTGTHHHTKKTEEQTKLEIDDIFTKADINKDKKIDKNELISYVIENLKKLHNESTQEEFIKIDKNDDNKISLDEYFIYHHDKTSKTFENLALLDNSTQTILLLKKTQHEAARFKAADSSGDGFLDVNEYLLMKYPVFFPHMASTVIHDYIADLDTNVDGFVDKTEYTNHFHVSDPMNKTREQESLKKHQAEFDEHDKDKNGKIDPEEYYAILKPGYEEPARSEMEHLFQETDDDKDGSIIRSEIEKHSHLWVGEDLIGGGSHQHDEDLEDEDYSSHHYDDEL